MVIWSYTKKKKKKEGNMVCVYIYIYVVPSIKKKKKKNYCNTWSFKITIYMTWYNYICYTYR